MARGTQEIPPDGGGDVDDNQMATTGQAELEASKLESSWEKQPERAQAPGQAWKEGVILVCTSPQGSGLRAGANFMTSAQNWQVFIHTSLRGHFRAV